MGWSRVEFLETGDRYFNALLEEIRRARETVSLEFYIFRFDRLGKEILQTLCDAQNRGVKVFLRLDGIGSRDHLKEISEFCSEKELELEVFHPLPFERARAFFAVGFARADSFFTRWKLINRRTHRKLVLIDEHIAFAGGMNVDEVQSERYCGSQSWHDLSVRLEGSGTRELSHAYWFRPYRHFTFQSCLLNYSWRLRQARNNWIAHAFSVAKSRIWLISPYFAPTPAMLFQLRMAAKRGVDIRIILTQKTDVPVSRLAALGLYRKLLAWGVKVYEYEPRLLHRKLSVVDQVALVGSGNFNSRSFLHDLELDVILRLPAHVETAAALFRRDQEDCREINKVYLEQLGYGERFLSWIAGWFTYWL